MGRLFLPAETNLLKAPKLHDYALLDAAATDDTATPKRLADRHGLEGEHTFAGDGKYLAYSLRNAAASYAAADWGIAPGDTITFSADTEAVYDELEPGFTVLMAMYFWTAGWVQLGAGIETAIPLGRARPALTIEVPATTANMRIDLIRAFGLAGKHLRVHVGNAKLAKIAADTPYFDGDSPGCAWTGAAHASPSTRTATTLTYAGLCTITSAGPVALNGGAAYQSNGMVIVSGAAKPAAWQAAFAATKADPRQVWREFCAVGDVLIPLDRDSRAYVKEG